MVGGDHLPAPGCASRLPLSKSGAARGVERAQAPLKSVLQASHGEVGISQSPVSVALIEDKAVRASARGAPRRGFPSALPSPMHCPRTGWSNRRFGPGFRSQPPAFLSSGGGYRGRRSRPYKGVSLLRPDPRLSLHRRWMRSLVPVDSRCRNTGVDDERSRVPIIGTGRLRKPEAPFNRSGTELPNEASADEPAISLAQTRLQRDEVRAGR